MNKQPRALRGSFLALVRRGRRPAESYDFQARARSTPRRRGYKLARDLLGWEAVMDERDLATYWNFVEGSILMQATICNFLIDQGILDQTKIKEALENALYRLPSESLAMGAPFRLMLSNIDKHRASHPI